MRCWFLESFRKIRKMTDVRNANQSTENSGTENRMEKKFPVGNFQKIGCSSWSCPLNSGNIFKNWEFLEIQTGIFGSMESAVKKLLISRPNNNEQLIQSNGCNETITRCVAIFELQISMCSSVVYLRSADTTSTKIFSSLLPHFYNLNCYELTQIPGYLEREL